MACDPSYQTSSTDGGISTNSPLQSDATVGASGSCGSFHSSERIQSMIEHSLYHDCKTEFSDLYHECKTEFSRDHWTEVKLESAGHDDLTADTVANLEEKWGKTLNLEKKGILSLGRKIGEGGQAEIFEALLGKRSSKLIAKVFPKQSLSSLQEQWPRDIFKLEGVCKYIMRVFAGVLLKDGRFAFLFLLYGDDLRSVIDKNMMRNNSQEPPLKTNEALHYMIRIACGMKSLHSKGFLHRDLKASNVLVWSPTEDRERHSNSSDVEAFYCAVADYESSIGVKGTGFWRAPEVLQAIQNGGEPEFTKKADVYSYAMTCFEILTGLMPFEGHPKTHYNLVISGQRPELPRHVCAQMRELLNRCWHALPEARPEFSEIVQLVGEIMVTELKISMQIIEAITEARPNSMSI